MCPSQACWWCFATRHQALNWVARQQTNMALRYIVWPLCAASDDAFTLDTGRLCCGRTQCRL